MDDPFTSLVGASRYGCSRPETALSYIERFQYDWAASAALKELEAEIDDGNVTEAFKVLAVSGYGVERPAQEDLYDQLLHKLVYSFCYVERQKRKPEAKDLWEFLGHPPMVKCDSFPAVSHRGMIFREKHKDVFLEIFDDAFRKEPKSFTEAYFALTAETAYLKAICDYQARSINAELSNGHKDEVPPILRRVLGRSLTKELEGVCQKIIAAQGAENDFPLSINRILRNVSSYAYRQILEEGFLLSGTSDERRQTIYEALSEGVLPQGR